jgi:hypothetical protein
MAGIKRTHCAPTHSATVTTLQATSNQPDPVPLSNSLELSNSRTLSLTRTPSHTHSYSHTHAHTGKLEKISRLHAMSEQESGRRGLANSLRRPGVRGPTGQRPQSARIRQGRIRSQSMTTTATPTLPIASSSSSSPSASPRSVSVRGEPSRSSAAQHQCHSRENSHSPRRPTPMTLLQSSPTRYACRCAAEHGLAFHL